MKRRVWGFFLDTLILLLNVWLYYYNFSLSQSTENIVWGYPFLPDKYFKHMTSICFSSYHKEQEKLIATGRLRRGFCLTITVVNFFFLEIFWWFFFSYFFFHHYVFVQNQQSCALALPHWVTSWYCCGEGERIFHVCRNVDFFPPWNVNCALEGWSGIFAEPCSTGFLPVYVRKCLWAWMQI